MYFDFLPSGKWRGRLFFIINCEHLDTQCHFKIYIVPTIRSPPSCSRQCGHIFRSLNSETVLKHGRQLLKAYHVIHLHIPFRFTIALSPWKIWCHMFFTWHSIFRFSIQIHFLNGAFIFFKIAPTSLLVMDLLKGVCLCFRGKDNPHPLLLTPLLLMAWTWVFFWKIKIMLVFFKKKNEITLNG